MKITQFGNEILRSRVKTLSKQEILSESTKVLIENMKSILVDANLGIGLAAPQVDYDLSLAVVEIHKTPVRFDTEELSLVIINPTVTKFFGKKFQMWEGCISSGAGKAGLFAMVPRYKKIELQYYDENAVIHSGIFEGLAAHVIQHEVDHLEGILFVDKVKDTKTIMTYGEYKKMKRKETKTFKNTVSKNR